MGADGKRSENCSRLMALGTTLHIGWEFLHNTSPFGSDIGFWRIFTPWITVNVAVGMLGSFISGLTAKD